MAGSASAAWGFTSSDLGAEWHCSSGHAEVVSHIAQPEGPTTRIYNYVLGVFGEKKKKREKNFKKKRKKGKKEGKGLKV